MMMLVLAMAVLLYVGLVLLGRRERIKLGLDSAVIVAADDSCLAAPTLVSKPLGLVGCPDHLVRSGRTFIPVEHKPSARRVQPSHVMQVAAQCALVQEVYGVRPAYGLLVLAGGVQERVPFTPALEQRLQETMAQMRELLAAGAEPGARWDAPKCRACGFRTTCWE